MQQNLTHLSRSLAQLLGGAVLALGLSATTLPAQSLFSPAMRVNQGIITHFELEQRIRLMEVLRIPGDPEQDARRALIEEKLKMQAVEEAGIEVPPEDVQLGIDDFASRTRLSTEEFLAALQDEGVSAETVRDFVRNQLAWRDYISARYLAQARPTEDEINRALGLAGGGGLQVLLSEIIIPITPQTVDQVDDLAAQISELTSYDAFASAAVQFSAADTRSQGGQMPWMPLAQLPPAFQPVILALEPGEVSSPITLPNAVALFQMRGLREAPVGTPSYASIEYAAYAIAGGRSPETLKAAAELQQSVDTCDDLYGVAKGQPVEVLDRVSAKPGEIPQDIALELAKLDPGETSIAVTRNNGQTLLFLMLCNRTRDLGGDASREDVANALTQQRLETLANSLLEQLRADAVIIEE
ncbi:peptidylprolyl isomerase [Ruegeria marina]|uniref:Parvulin-like PPIase n=1 Tax=Ruegeria marina TaxID=639004 RepID=A0A1G6JJP8_9RHOB|nr:peptidylprolyl isomerase [Ruegeria marina]SDC18969.1 periplasmic chaperone for outer membrane proteins SurA [Ruegeria marina]